MMYEMYDMKIGKFGILIILVSILLPACGGVPPDNNGSAPGYTVGGTVSNLLVDGLVLQNNGCDDLAISANSISFTFPTTISDGEGYAVTIKTQPETESCMITQASGTVAGKNVVDVGIQCLVRSPVVEPHATPDSLT